MNNMFSYKSLRVLIILLNDLLILNISLYISYFLRTEAFIDLFLIENVILFSNLVYCFIFLYSLFISSILDILIIILSVFI